MDSRKGSISLKGMMTARQLSTDLGALGGTLLCGQTLDRHCVRCCQLPPFASSQTQLGVVQDNKGHSRQIGVTCEGTKGRGERQNKWNQEPKEIEGSLEQGYIGTQINGVKGRKPEGLERRRANGNKGRKAYLAHLMALLQRLSMRSGREWLLPVLLSRPANTMGSMPPSSSGSATYSQIHDKAWKEKQQQSHLANLCIRAP